MKKKKATSIIALILVLLMVVGLVASIIPATAYAVEQSEIDEIQSQKNELSNRVQECQDRLNQLKDEQANVLELKSTLDEQNRAANEQLALVAQEVALYDELVEEKAQELEKARNREEDQLKLYRTRVRAMEESGGYNILALVLNSGSFGEFLTAMDDMAEIMERDKDLEKQYIAAREETEAMKEEYEAVRAEFEEKQEALREEQAELEAQIEAAYAELAELEDAIDQAVKEYEAAEAAEAAAAATILNMIAQYNEQKRQEAAASGGNSNGSSGGSTGGNTGGGDSGSTGGNSGGNSGLNPGGASGTGSFIWPVPCSTRVTSRFGYRIDPFTYQEKYHSGIDIDGFGNDGNIIVAADSGTVITASYDSGYGNYVVIDHGNYTQTLYAHMSGMAVSVGTWVEQGQTIGYLGATGRATGTHCHYEIFVDGGRVDPASYYSGLSYWNC